MKTIRNKLFLLAALAVIGFMTPMPAAAGGNDLVSDDGTVVSAADVTSMAGEVAASTRPYRGTGVLSAEDRAEATAGSSVQEILNLPFVGGKVGAESVIGADTRVRTYTTTYPERATALVTFTGGYCTGWFIGPNTVATAGHCVHTGGSAGAWRDRYSFRIYPGYNAGSAPYGYATAKSLNSVTGWTVSGSELYDYGVIKLNTTLGNTVGWYGYFAQTSFTGFPTTIIGYPGDATPAKSQWIAADKVYTSTAYQAFYRNDTYGGMSGSAVWYDRPAGSAGCSNGPCAFAIHAYGVHGASPHSVYNHGVSFTSSVVSNLTYWRNLP